MKNNNGNLLVSFLTGAAIGTALGILFAPNKGSETRGKIKHGVSDAAHDISDRVKHAKDDLTKTAHDKKEAFNKKLEDALSKMNHKAEDVLNALEDKLDDLKKKNAQWLK